MPPAREHAGKVAMTAVREPVGVFTLTAARERTMDAAVLVAVKLALGALVLAMGFTHVSDDDYARTVIAEQFAHAPRLDPSGTSWLPLPFWLAGLAMAACGRTLATARGRGHRARSGQRRGSVPVNARREDAAMACARSHRGLDVAPVERMARRGDRPRSLGWGATRRGAPRDER